MPGNKSKTKTKIANEGRYGSLKSRRGLRMLYVKVPGGNTNIQFKKTKPSKAKCGKCSKVLAGVPHHLPSKIKKIPKTSRRPERPFGGVLCSSCMRLTLKETVRAEK